MSVIMYVESHDIIVCRRAHKIFSMHYESKKEILKLTAKIFISWPKAKSVDLDPTKPFI